MTIIDNSDLSKADKTEFGRCNRDVAVLKLLRNPDCVRGACLNRFEIVRNLRTAKFFQELGHER